MKTDMEKVKLHFESEAEEYDKIIIELIPYYSEMVDALVSAIPFNREKKLRIIDLGCGTGKLSKEIAEKFPNAEFTCVDIAGNMLDIAKSRLKKRAEYINADFNSYSFNGKYDLAVSSLALHHLTQDKDIYEFYGKIYDLLNDNGLFINADVVLGSTKALQDVFIEKWIEYMKKSVSIDIINNKWLPNYYSEDRPVPLMKHLDFLNKQNFKNIDVIWKYFNYAVYIGEK
jgi:tRNA (cmo5U34)-methyltransferase